MFSPVPSKLNTADEGEGELMGREIHGVSLIILLMPFFSFYAGESHDPVAFARTHLIDEHNHINRVLFSPDDSAIIEQTIIGLIRTSQEIKGALYLLTYQPFIKEFIAAKKRGAKIELVFDKSALASKFIYDLPYAGIPLLMYDPADSTRNFQALMHLKTVIFYGAFSGARNIVAFGSMNWSGNGLKRNSDHINFSDDSHLVAKFDNTISGLLKRAKAQVNPVSKKDQVLQKFVKDSFVNKHRKVVIDKPQSGKKKSSPKKINILAKQPKVIPVVVRTLCTMRRVVKIR